jgi:hypothetical protein
MGVAAQDPALGDLDGDGTDEVVVAVTTLDRLQAVDSSGAAPAGLSWPVNLSSAPQGPPVIGHLEGGGPQGVLVMLAGGLSACNDSARVLARFPKPGGAGSWPTFADLLGDGASKVLAGSGFDSSLYVYDAGPSSAAPVPQAWPTPRGNFARTGSHLYLSPDALPPAGVGDLAAELVAPDSVRLTWTAPGDDGVVGRAASYDLWTTTFRPVAGRPRGGDAVAGVPPPDSAGAVQSVTLGGFSAGTTVWCWLRALDVTGNASRCSNVTGLTLRLGPARAATEELAVRRRPSSLPVTLDWAGSGAEGIRLYDVTGRLVRTLRLGPGGRGSVQWNGRDESGRLVPAGLYFARLTGGSLHTQTRVVLLP